MGYSPWGHKELDTIERLHFHFHYGPTLTSIHDYWKNHSFDCTDFCHQREVFAFQCTV